MRGGRTREGGIPGDFRRNQRVDVGVRVSREVPESTMCHYFHFGEATEAFVEDLNGAGVALARFSQERGVYDADAGMDETGDLLADPGHAYRILETQAHRFLPNAGRLRELRDVDVALEHALGDEDIRFGGGVVSEFVGRDGEGGLGEEGHGARIALSVGFRRGLGGFYWTLLKGHAIL